jgi:hypothetical protein
MSVEGGDIVTVRGRRGGEGTDSVGFTERVGSIEPAFPTAAPRFVKRIRLLAPQASKICL